MAESVATIGLDLPPIYRPVMVGGETAAFDKACALAAAGEAEAGFVWSDRADRAECAVVLAPDRPLAAARLVLLVAQLAAGEAIGALAPPLVAVTFGWPDRIDVNGARAGALRLGVGGAGAEDAVPDWMVLGLTLSVAGDPADDSPGRDLNRTSLYDEGGGTVTTCDVLATFARYLLKWLNRWQDEGFAPAAEAWSGRASGLGKPVELDHGGRRRKGRPVGIDENGALILEVGKKRHHLDLASALGNESDA